MVISHHLCDGKVNCVGEITQSSFQSFCLCFRTWICLSVDLGIIIVLLCANSREFILKYKRVLVLKCVQMYHCVFVMSIKALINFSWWIWVMIVNQNMVVIHLSFNKHNSEPHYSFCWSFAVVIFPYPLVHLLYCDEYKCAVSGAHGDAANRSPKPHNQTSFFEWICNVCRSSEYHFCSFFSPQGRVRPKSVSDIAVLLLFLEHHN